MLFAVVLLLLGVSSAQRPSNATICDYYAIENYGANTTATQYRLMQSILALAFGGAGPLPNVASTITGIFNPGSFDGTPVDLQPWFNGSKESTNLNDQAVGINWLDGGGTAPLFSFLKGETQNLTFPNGTKEERLFSHWLSAFQHIYGCTLPTQQPASPGGQLDLAYVHKFMDLNHTDIGHFIDQLTLSSQHFNFSDNDAQSLDTQMNAQFNVRCAPPVGTQLYSLCQDDSCPLAFPSPDCAAYSNLGPSGIPVTNSGSSGSAATPTPSSTASSSAAGTTTAAPQSSSAVPATKSASLSPGGIAGAAIGGAALLFLFIGGMLYIFRRRKHNDPYVPNPSNPSYTAPSYTDPHTSYMSNQPEHYTGPPLAEMESPRFGGSPEMGQLTPKNLSPGHISPVVRSP